MQCPTPIQPHSRNMQKNWHHDFLRIQFHTEYNTLKFINVILQHVLRNKVQNIILKLAKVYKNYIMLVGYIII